uniref:DUF4258 domain-containing protein n=1 Tax=Candidatus Kentrum sp. LFY TaxID=2126342 RepID=A0A450X4Y4_9GAMM|nr:MAG: protein of unknown function (DUF4258) [Candidatus Kentron sp. LFY]
MKGTGYRDSARIVSRLREQAFANSIHVTIHAHQEMVVENVSYDAVREVLFDAEVIENYPDHQRGPCCLLCGLASSRHPLHIVCTTSLDVVIIITVYEPKPPKWITPFQRGDRNEM